jgi:hypothetical protein
MNGFYFMRKSQKEHGVILCPLQPLSEKSAFNTDLCVSKTDEQENAWRMESISSEKRKTTSCAAERLMSDCHEYLKSILDKIAVKIAQ